MLIASSLPYLKPAQEVVRLYWAHENPYGRELTEKLDIGFGCGHDTMFYNALKVALSEGKHVWDIPGFWESIQSNYRYSLIRAAMPFIDRVISVGPQTRDEFIFGGAPKDKITLVPNGIPVRSITLAEKQHHMALMRQYSQNLGLFSGASPDYVVTQVARGVPSKGFWRSVGIFDNMESILGNQTAVFYLLVHTGKKSPQEIREFEKMGWPLSHSSELDLRNYDKVMWGYIQHYNRTHTNTQIVFVNQFGWDRQSCGDRMPEGASMDTIRMGTDIELNPAIYGPFEISPIEPLPYGAVISVSNACGCAGFLADSTAHLNGQSPIVIADYINPGRLMLEETLAIGRRDREHIESGTNRLVAREVLSRAQSIPLEERLRMGQELAKDFSWGSIMWRHLMPIFTMDGN